MENRRVNPDELLKAIEHETKKQNKGNLKIFFGYAAGVGKTYAMLKEAHNEKQHGIDVVVGYIEPHTRVETMELVNGLEVLPTKAIEYNNIKLQELDIDLVLKRKPQLVLVDELAHTNAQGCRHNKRYQDVEELLKAGIDVYTTINVQHIESLCDTIASITGVLVQERIPDKVFDEADQVKLVDIEPIELIERLNQGKVYRKNQAEKALSNFFSVENLTALREIALRRCADRVNKLAEASHIRTGNEYFIEEHILVCLSPSPTNSKIIRTAARMATAFRANFTALFVETLDFALMSDKDKEQLRSNIRLAKQLGATIEAAYGDDIAFQISEFVRLLRVSKIVVGRSNARKRFFFSKPTLTEQLLGYAPNLDIYIIPDSDSFKITKKKVELKKNIFNFPDTIKAIGIIVVATLIGYAFYLLNFSEANIITVYILGVLITALVTTQRFYSLASSIASVLVFNFYFTEPRFTFNAYDSGYLTTFLITFLSAFITGSLTTKIKQQAKLSAQTAYRTKVLLETNQLIQQENSKDGIVLASANQLVKLLNRDVIFFTVEGDYLAEPKIFMVDADGEKLLVSENEKAVATWVFKNNTRAGATTNTLANAKYLYLAVRVANQVYGVVGIAIGDKPLELYENSITLSILGECALALENEQAAIEKEATAILAKNEQLRANLLRSISHDLRTPLTSISGNADMLMGNDKSLDDSTRLQIYSSIYSDSLWLINLVENLLSVTRIEDGTMNLRKRPELMNEIITEALKHLNRKGLEHNISVNYKQEFALVKVDAHLIVQVIINIVDNAIRYTPKGSDINIEISKSLDKIVVDISDNGPGICDEAKTRIFDMFYTVDKEIADCRRSLGLGLALCKSIINAHDGEIEVMDNQPKGTIFRFTLPAQEVDLNE